MHRIAFALPVIGLLGGCAAAAVPPALTAVSYAADGASLVMTGKSVSDHAISELADQDCALWRLVRLKRPCRAYVEPSAQLADAAATGATGHDGAPAQAAARPAGRAVVIQSELAPLAGAPAEMSRIVLGSFVNRDNAERLAAAHSGLGAHVAAARGEAVTIYRVLTAARPRPAAEALRRDLAAAGVAGTWLMPLAPSSQPSLALAGPEG